MSRPRALIRHRLTRASVGLVALAAASVMMLGTTPGTALAGPGAPEATCVASRCS